MSSAAVTLPRPVYPGSASMITRRCTQRMCLLRPDREMNNAFVYCLAVAAQRHETDILNFVQMPNHLHDDVYDRHGNAPEFYAEFHRLLAKCGNALRGRWENFFSTEQVCVVRLETREDLINKIVYVATNPVKAGLVARVADYPGSSGYEALVTGQPLRATRPKFFFAEDGEMPEEVTLHVRIPPELGDHDQIVSEVKERVAAFEAAEASRRAAAGERVMGRYAILRQSWRYIPMSREPRRGLRPTFAARSLWSRLEAIQRKREFLADYREAWLALAAGTPIPFPTGTYWLRRFLNVEVTPTEKIN